MTNRETMREIDAWFFQQPEPVRSCLLFLRQHILQQDANLTEAWKYKMPFYCYNGRMCCYLWVHKRFAKPYLGIVEGKRVEHPELIQEKRSRMKILLIDPEANIPVRKINSILRQMLACYTH